MPIRFMFVLLATAHGLQAQGVITTFAGMPWSFDGDGKPAVDAPLGNVAAVAVDRDGSVIFRDTGNCMIHRLRSDGTIQVLAGSGRCGGINPSDLRVPARRANLSSTWPGLTIDSQRNIYFADNIFVYRLTPDGFIERVAGSGSSVASGDGGPARAAGLTAYDIAIDREDRLIIVDRFNHRLRRVARDGTISTIAGTGETGSAGDGGAALTAKLNEPEFVAVGPDGSIFFTQDLGARIRRISPNGTISTYAGNGVQGITGDNGPATQARIVGLDIDVAADGTLYQVGQGPVRKITPAGIISTIAGPSYPDKPLGDGGPALEAGLYWPTGIAVHPDGNVYIADNESLRLRVITPAGVIRTVAGNGKHRLPPDGTDRRQSWFWRPMRIAGTPNGEMVISNQLLHRVARIDRTGKFGTPIGTGRGFSGGDGGPAVEGSLRYPWGMAVDRLGNILVGEFGSPRVRRIDNQGQISTFAGRTCNAFSGDGGPATSACFGNDIPEIKADQNGNVFIVDRENNRIRRVNAQGVISTYAGNGTRDFGGDGGTATSAAVNWPMGIALDPQGNLYISDTGNQRVRRVAPNGVLTTVAGTGERGYSGDGGPATQARINEPTGLAVDSKGNLYIADSFNSRVRRVSPDGTITTIAGNGRFEYTGDGGLSTAAGITRPEGLFIDSRDNLYITDTVEHVIRLVRLTSLAVSPANVAFAGVPGGPALNRVLEVTLPNGDPRTFQVSVSTADGGNWLRVSPNQGVASTVAAARIVLTASPLNLGPGTYRATVTVTAIVDGAPAEQVPVNVTLSVASSSQSLVVSPTGVSLRAAAGSTTTPTQLVRISNAGIGSMGWSAQASTTSGGSWLSVEPAQGTASAGDLPSELQLRANITGLAPGSYYGSVVINAPGASGAPKTITVALEVTVPEEPPRPEVEPGGLIFVAPTASATVEPQSVRIANRTANQINYVATASIQGEGSWLAVEPASGSVAAGQSGNVTVRVNPAGLAPGVYKGTVVVELPEFSSESRIEAILIIPGAQANAARRQADGCVPKTLQLAFNQPGATFRANAGWPVPILVRALDDCGNEFNDGVMTASFSNGDPALSFTSLGGGLWSATWTVRGRTDAGVTITARAQSTRNAELQGAARVGGGLGPGKDVPVVAVGGVLNAASYAVGAPVAPGSIVSIFGSGLASRVQAAASLPLQREMDQTLVSLGGVPLPLVFVSPNQINAVVPFEVELNADLQLLIRRPGLLSTPEAVTVASATPGLFTVDNTGRGQAHIYYQSEDGRQLRADSNSPVRPGDAIVIYCTGLGPVDQPIPSNDAAPVDPLARVVGEAKVSIGEAPAQVLFAGPTPGFVGLYQVNAIVPSAATRGNAAVSVTIGEQESLRANLVIQ